MREGEKTKKNKNRKVNPVKRGGPSVGGTITMEKKQGRRANRFSGAREGKEKWEYQTNRVDRV